MDLTFENIYRYPLLAMKVIRAHQDIPKNITWLITFMMTHGICTTYVLLFSYNIIYVDLKANNLAQACKNGTFVVIYVATTFQYLVMIFKETLLRSLFKTVKDDYYKAKKLDAEAQEVIIDYAKKTVSVSKLWYVMGLGGVIVFPIKNIALHLYYYHMGTFRKIPLFDMKYPYMSEELKDNIFVFLAQYSFLMFDATYCGWVYVAFAPLGPNLMLHACGQLEVLTKRMNVLYTVDDITAELRSIAIELQRIYTYVAEIQDTFRVAYELTLKITVFILPITAYEVIEAYAEGDVSVEFFVFILGAFVNASSPCYFSELLMAKGEEFRMAVYFSGWEQTYDRRSRKMIALLLQRASRPTALSTMFRVLCLDALTDVYHQSYAIFNLMNAMWK